MGQWVALMEPGPAQPAENSSSRAAPAEHGIRVADVFRPSCIDVVPARVGRSSMLSLLVSLLVRACRVPHDQAETVIKGLLEREQFTAAAVGNGLALPYLRTPAVRQPVGAVAIVPHGVNFSVPCGMPIRLVLLVLFPEDGRQEQIEFIERLVSLAKDETLPDLVTPELTPAQAYDFLCTWDSRWMASN